MSMQVPQLSNRNVVVRLANTEEEIQQANHLVFQNYVDCGYWLDDTATLENNRYFKLPTRRVVVAVEHARVLGTMSIVLDSRAGIPADSFQPAAVDKLRRHGGRLAEMSALAIDRDRNTPRHLIDFLFAFAFQYGYFYAGLDRFVAVCHPKHARFHKHRYGFELVDTAGLYAYVKAPGQIVVRDLAEGIAAALSLDSPHPEFLRFLHLEQHASLKLPPYSKIERKRRAQWTACVTHMLPQAV
jgi:hypothetical protein